MMVLMKDGDRKMINQFFLQKGLFPYSSVICGNCRAWKFMTGFAKFKFGNRRRQCPPSNFTLHPNIVSFLKIAPLCLFSSLFICASISWIHVAGRLSQSVSQSVMFLRFDKDFIISWAKLWNILGISWLYFGHILEISRAYLFASRSASWVSIFAEICHVRWKSTG